MVRMRQARQTDRGNTHGPSHGPGALHPGLFFATKQHGLNYTRMTCPSNHTAEWSRTTALPVDSLDERADLYDHKSPFSKYRVLSKLYSMSLPENAGSLLTAST